MGVDNYFYLFDLEIYQEKVAPAYEAFFKRGNTIKLISLIEEIIDKLRKRPKPPRELYLHSEKEYLEAIKILTGELVITKEDGRLYSHRLTPFLFFRPKKLSPKRQFVQDWLGRELVSGLCVPYNKKVVPVINMMCYPLVGYLYKHSKWIENFFAGTREEELIFLKISAPEYCPGYFLKQGVETFRNYFLKVPEPKGTASDTLKKDYSQLRKMLDIAVQEPNLTILEILE